MKREIAAGGGEGVEYTDQISVARQGDRLRGSGQRGGQQRTTRPLRDRPGAGKTHDAGIVPQYTVQNDRRATGKGEAGSRVKITHRNSVSLIKRG